MGGREDGVGWALGGHWVGIWWALDGYWMGIGEVNPGRGWRKGCEGDDLRGVILRRIFGFWREGFPGNGFRGFVFAAHVGLIHLKQMCAKDHILFAIHVLVHQFQGLVFLPRNRNRQQRTEKSRMNFHKLFYVAGGIFYHQAFCF